MDTFWIASSHLPHYKYHPLLFCAAKGLLEISVVESGVLCTQVWPKHKFPAKLTQKALRTSSLLQFRNIFVWLTVEFAPTLIMHPLPFLILQHCELCLRHKCQSPTVVSPESFILNFPIWFSYLLKCLSRIRIFNFFFLKKLCLCLNSISVKMGDSIAILCRTVMKITKLKSMKTYLMYHKCVQSSC